MRSIRAVVGVAAFALLLPAAGCVRHHEPATKALADANRPVPPQPTEHWLDEDAERRNKLERKTWLEHMHRTAPDIDWRTVERQNGVVEQARRNRLARTAAVTGHWSEVGSSNLAGRMHTAVIGPGGQKLYGGSSLGGVWRGNLDGSGWEPLGDNLSGGAHELVVLPGEQTGEPDVMLAATDGGLVHVSRDEGLTWETPAGADDLVSVRGVAVLQVPGNTILVYGRGPSTGNRPTVLASTDYGRTFAARWQGTTGWNGWMWVPRTGPGAASRVYVVDAGKVGVSTDGGFTFPFSVSVVPGANRAVLAGSEAGLPTLYAAFRAGSQWRLYRSDDAGFSWAYTFDIPDFWESLVASTLDPNLVVFGGVEGFRSTDGGATFTKINNWWDYYGDPANRLHADIPGLHCWPDPAAPTQESCYVSTDGGIYVSQDGLSSVQNISLSGLAVSQYYSTHSSRLDWDRVSAGAQDQGYQAGVVQHTGGPGPTTPLEQLISGDYGHLTSGDGSHDLIVSTYPGFILIQDGVVDPPLHSADFPSGSLHAWLPPVVADPTLPGTFYFCGDWLYRYDRVSETQWQPTIHSDKQFGGSGVDGSYLSALAFTPTDPDRVYAVNDVGRVFYSTDHGVTWTESSGGAPPQHYFYGNAITVHPSDPLEVAIGGSGYSAAGVVRSTDGGETWFAEATGLPSTMVYALVYAEDGSGDLYAGTETGAWRWDRQTGLWENIMSNEAPVTIYWSAEVVNDGGTIRYGTYGRGMWDYELVPGDRDGDGIPDAQDLCANHDDPGQLDGDLDGTGNVCDNCPATSNPDQANADGDAAGDACDCAPLDADVFSVPPEVTGLRWRSPTVLEWESAVPLSGSDTEHLVYLGLLGEFPVGSSTSCTVTTTQGSRLIEDHLPAPGTGFWYLVHGTNACGVGSLGSWGTGAERSVPTCAP
jgi:photosystem II stability/assembly factor-like uncharacterized protein